MGVSIYWDTMALTIGYAARFCLAFVLTATGLFLVWSGFYLQELTVVMSGWLISLAGAATATYNEMRRLGEGLGK